MSYYLPGSPYILSRGFGRGHFGQDWAAPKGTSIPVAADGKVVFSDAQRDANGNYKGWGEYVVVEHYGANGNVTGYTLYAHMDSRTVGVGDSVKMGDKIGEVGNTGRSYSTTGGDGSHLHIEVRPIDPNNPPTDRNGDLIIDWHDVLPINPGTFTGWDSFKGAYNWILDYFGIGDPSIPDSLSRFFTLATQFRFAGVDPLTLDLDGDRVLSLTNH